MAGYLYVPLGMEGAVPYRDYYMPVTPLTFFVAQLSAGLGDLRIVHMAGSLVLPPILFVSLYSLTRPLASARVSSVLACFGSVSLISFRMDILGGWNPLVVVLTAACGALVIRSLAMDGYRTVLWAVAGGIVGGLAVLAKQTAMVPLGLAFLLLGVFALVPRCRSESPRFLVTLFGALAGFCVLLGAFVVWLIAQDALGAFIENMTSFGGKNPSVGGAATKMLTSLGYSFLAPLTSAVLMVVALWQVSTFYGVAQVSRSSVPGRLALVLLTAISIGLLFELTSPELAVGQAAAFGTMVILLALSRARDPFGSNQRLRILAVVVVAVPVEFGIIMGLANPRMLQGGLIPLESLWVSIAITAALVFAFWPRVLCVSDEGSASRRPVEGPASRGDSEFQLSWPVLSLSAALTVGWWVVVVQSTAGPVPAAWILPTSVPLTAALVSLLSRVGARMARSMLLLGALGTTALFIVNAWVSPYVWNGWTQPSVFGRYSLVSSGALTGMLARDSVVDFNDRLAESIEKAAADVGGDDQTLFEFGNFPIAYALSDLAVHRVTECPNHWIDLCPQSVALSDLARFASNPSDVVVWVDIPEKALRRQEESFDLDRSSYRDWSQFRDDQVRNGAWQEVDRIEPGEWTPNRYAVTVYAVDRE